MNPQNFEIIEVITMYSYYFEFIKVFTMDPKNFQKLLHGQIHQGRMKRPASVWILLLFDLFVLCRNNTPPMGG